MAGPTRSGRSPSRSPDAPDAGRFVVEDGPPAPRAGAGAFRLLALALLPLAGSALTGCDFFTVDSDPAGEARIVLDGEDTVPLEMVTSNQWEPGGTAGDGSQQIILLNSDTAEVEVPFESAFSLEGENRFFVRVKNPDPDAGPTVTMQVFLDDEGFYDRTRTLEGDERLQFTYRQR